jgi:hypothetical protein
MTLEIIKWFHAIPDLDNNKSVDINFFYRQASQNINPKSNILKVFKDSVSAKK